MKNLKSTPKDKGFFETYANLIVTLKKSGYAAQVVSALTEIGGIYTAAYVSLAPIVPAFAVYLAILIAILGTAVIELGLRKLLPHTVDSVLHKRFSGLHLSITILIWVSALILLTASGVLSFQNSKIIVEQVTPEADQETTTATDSIYQLQTLAAQKQFSSDSSMIANKYTSLATSTAAAYQGKIGAKQRDYSNLKNKESRTGRSYATAKDRVKADIATLEAEQAGKLAVLETEKAKELSTLQSDFKALTADARAERKEGIAEVKAANDQAEGERAATVSKYGNGTAYFTLICLVVLIVSIVLDRIHVKGSEISETVELSQRDINPPAWKERLEAWKERRHNKALIAIAKYREKTPPPPMPEAPAKIYDPTKLIGSELEVITEDEDDESLTIKRRQIGFRYTKNSGDVLGTRNTRKLAHEIEADTDTKTENKSNDLPELKQRLKMYRRRLGQHKRKAKEQEKKKGEANQRTLDAIQNNQQWVEHYTRLINQYQNE